MNEFYNGIVCVLIRNCLQIMKITKIQITRRQIYVQRRMLLVTQGTLDTA